MELQPDGKVLRGTLVELLTPSPDRRASACPLSERCGGCDWIHLDEKAQRRAKLEIVLSTLEHLGGISRAELEVHPPGPPPRAMGYRRRAVLHPAGGALAYFGRRSHERIPIERCPALVPPLEGLPVRLAVALGAALRDTREVHLLAQGDRAAIAVFLSGQARERHRSACQAALRLAEVAGVVLVPEGGPAELFGRPVLRAPAPLAPDVPLYLRPDVFSQASAEANEELVRAAIELLALRPEDRVLELFSGSGNFTFALARRAASVVAVESARASMELARRSVREAGLLGQVRFIEGDCRKVSDGLIAEGLTFDALLLDPPRTGAKGVERWARRLGVRTVCYVACDPASLARDAAALREAGLRPRALAVVDMFPQTHHVEAVLSFVREGEEA